MAVYINILNGGNITIGSGGSAPAANPKTRITFTDDSVVEYEWSGTVDEQTIIDAGIYEPPFGPYNPEPKIVEFGSAITTIDGIFGTFPCETLTSVVIPDSVITIDSGLSGCYNLTTLTLGNNI